MCQCEWESTIKVYHIVPWFYEVILSRMTFLNYWYNSSLWSEPVLTMACLCRRQQYSFKLLARSLHSIFVANILSLPKSMVVVNYVVNVCMTVSAYGEHGHMISGLQVLLLVLEVPTLHPACL